MSWRGEGRVPRTVFIGASSFGLRCAELVAELPCCALAGIVTAPRKFRISYAPNGVENIRHADFSSLAASRGIPLVVMQDRMSEAAVQEAMADWRPELILVVGWYHMVPKSLRERAPCFGLHPSLLPEYRGGAPLVWAMIEGATRTGISLFQLSDGVDDGAIAGQASCAIAPDDTIATLYARIEELGLDLLRRHLPEFAAGTLALSAQAVEGTRVYPQRSPDDGAIEWALPAHRLHDFIRAQTRPYPGAFFLDAKAARQHVWRSRVMVTDAAAGAAPATVLAASASGGLTVATGQGVIELIEIEDKPAARWWVEAGQPPELGAP